MIPVRISNPIKSIMHLNTSGMVPFFNNLPLKLILLSTSNEDLIYVLPRTDNELPK